MDPSRGSPVEDGSPSQIKLIISIDMYKVIEVDVTMRGSVWGANVRENAMLHLISSSAAGREL